MRARASCPTPTNASSHHIWGPGHLAPLPLMPHPTTLPGQYSSAWGSTNLTGQALHKYWMNWLVSIGWKINLIGPAFWLKGRGPAFWSCTSLGPPSDQNDANGIQLDPLWCHFGFLGVQILHSNGSLLRSTDATGSQLFLRHSWNSLLQLFEASPRSQGQNFPKLSPRCLPKAGDS